MHQFDRQRYDMLARVRDFGSTYGHLFPESSLAPQAFAVVTNALADMESRDVAQTTASVAARATRKREVRNQLEERLLLLLRTAQVLPGTDAAFRSHFVLPGSGNDQQLLTTARQVVERAAEVAPQFVAHGMASTFVTDLKTLIKALEDALRDRGMSRDQLVAARAGIRQAMANAFTAVWQLDVIVANHLGTDPVVREVWKRARRIIYPPKRRQPVAEQTPAVDTPTPAGAPVGSGVETVPLRLVTPTA